MDHLLKKLDDAPEAVKVQALDARITCKRCGNTSHTGDNCPEHSSEDVNFLNNNFSGSHPQPGWNSHPNIPFFGQGQEQVPDAEPEEEEEAAIDPPVEKKAPKASPHEFYDTGVLPFPP